MIVGLFVLLPIVLARLTRGVSPKGENSDMY